MASDPTAIYTQGWWPIDRQDPPLSIFTEGWFGAEILLVTPVLKVEQALSIKTVLQSPDPEILP